MKGLAVNSLFGAIGSLLALFAAVAISFWFIDFSILNTASCGEIDQLVYCFFDEKWDSETYLSAITDFYSTIITIIIGLLGVVAAFSYLTIRSSTLQKTEEATEQEVRRYFETIKAEEQLYRASQRAKDSQVNEINVRLEEIEVALYEAGILIDGELGAEDEEETDETN